MDHDSIRIDRFLLSGIDDIFPLSSDGASVKAEPNHSDKENDAILTFGAVFTYNRLLPGNLCISPIPATIRMLASSFSTPRPAFDHPQTAKIDPN